MRKDRLTVALTVLALLVFTSFLALGARSIWGLAQIPPIPTITPLPPPDSTALKLRADEFKQLYSIALIFSDCNQTCLWARFYPTAKPSLGDFIAKVGAPDSIEGQLGPPETLDYLVTAYYRQRRFYAIAKRVLRPSEKGASIKSHLTWMSQSYFCSVPLLISDIETQIIEFKLNRGQKWSGFGIVRGC